MSFGEIVTWPFAKLMVWLYNLTGNYGLALTFFALAVNLIMTPFMAKSKKSMMRSSRLQPKIQELQRRHEGNPQKLNAEMQKLYQEEGINPMSGCLWSLIPFPILIALYSVVRQPLTRMMFVAQDFVTVLQDYFVGKGLFEAAAGRASAYQEIELAKLTHANWASVTTDLADKLDPNLIDLDFNFLGLNLGDQPTISTLWQGPYTWAAIGLFLIPFISAGLSYLSMKISSASNPTPGGDAQQQATMNTMNLMMPLMSVWICFVMPAAMGIYWIANSLFGMARDYLLTKKYQSQLDAEDAVKAAERAERDAEMEAKKAEYERLKAEGKTAQNTNTSKKKLQASEKQKSDERKAALDRADRAARRERLGIKETEKPASQVGNRRYARGRAYVPDRFTNPENAEAATIAAAEASEDAPAIDEAVEVMDTAVETASAAVETAEEAVEVAAEEIPAADAPETEQE
ncbi:MAG: membrane protein insertase YidC [Oscillospiraceae bacterium]|nr:membrane protein insertase YidC [Oscillospiraceae bacterium]